MRNNVGLLRLLFASFVIVDHAPIMLDGDPRREPLVMLTHSIGLGEVAVGGFFMLSGFLITQSYMRSRTLRSFLLRRVLRIYPAFIVATLASVYVLGPLTGGDPTKSSWDVFWRMALLLTPPDIPGQLQGMTLFPFLNGSMWTIAYEFRCYLLTAFLGWCGLFRRPRWILALTAAALVLTTLDTVAGVHWRLQDIHRLPGAIALLLNPAEALRLLSLYLIGMSVGLYWGRIGPLLTRNVGLGCGCAALLLMCWNPHVARPAFMLGGGALIFWLALRADLGPLQRINDRWDISYGVYLYGWPIETYVRWLDPQISPWALIGISLPLALAFGAASWWGLEKWAKPAGAARPAPGKPALADLSGPVPVSLKQRARRGRVSKSDGMVLVAHRLVDPHPGI